MLQEGTSILFQDIVHVCVFMEELVMTRNYMFKNQMNILDDLLNILKNGMRVNAVRFERDRDSVGSIRFVTTWGRIKSQTSKIKPIIGIEPQRKKSSSDISL